LNIYLPALDALLSLNKSKDKVPKRTPFGTSKPNQSLQAATNTTQGKTKGKSKGK
jgi:hypothetical protein